MGDPAFDRIGVGGSTCGGQLYYTAILLDLPPEHEITERVVLGTLGGSISAAEAVNDSGVVVGMSTTPDDDRYHAFRWTPGDAGLEDLGTLGGPDSIAYDVDRVGTAVGTSDTAAGETRAFVAPVGEAMRSLGTLGGTESTAHAVNSDGVVVGTSSLPGDETSTAFWWDPSTEVMEAIPGLGEEHAAAYDVNDAGLVVGEVMLEDGGLVGFKWSLGDEAPTLLDDGESVSALLGVNERGVAVGDHSDDGVEVGYHAVALIPGLALPLAVPVPGLDGVTTAFAVNDVGVVAGQGDVHAIDPEADIPNPEVDDTEDPVAFVRTPDGTVVIPEGEEVSSVFTDVGRTLVVGTVELSEGGARAVVHPLASLTPAAGSEAAAVADPAMVPIGTRHGGTAIVVVAALGVWLVVRSGRLPGMPLVARPRRVGGRRLVSLGLAGVLLGGLVVAAPPASEPAVADESACAAELAAVEAAIAAVEQAQADLGNAPSQAAIAQLESQRDTAKNIWDEQVRRREELEARAARLVNAFNAWEHLHADLTSDVKLFTMGATKGVVPLVKVAVEVAARRAAGGPGPTAAEMKALTTALKSVGELAGRIGRRLNPVTRPLGILSDFTSVVRSVLGHRWAVYMYYDALDLLYDIEGSPPADDDRLKQLKDFYDLKREEVESAIAERQAAEQALQAAKRRLAEALAALNRCREREGLPPVDLPTYQLPEVIPTRDGSSSGDPHLGTFDRLRYDMHAEGEFWLTRSTTDDFGVQVRTTRRGGTQVSWTDGAAVVTPGGHEVVAETGVVLVDGEPATLPTLLDDMTYVADAGPDRVEVRLADGTVVDAFIRSNWLGQVIVALAEDRWGEVEGLLGDADGVVDGEGRNAAGEVVFGPDGLAGSDAHSLLYDDFASSWVVADDDRLIPGPRREYSPPAAPPAASFPQSDIDRATLECDAIGITEQPMLDMCIFDSLVTGEYPSDDPEAAATLLLMVLGDDSPPPIADAGNTPEVTPLTGARDIAAGAAHTCAVGADGHVACWGDNLSGQLGDGTTDASLVPVDVVGIADAVAVAAGNSHTCVVREEGTVSCWGYNLNGQLGNGGVPIRSSTPVDVVGITDATAIAAGENHSCVVRDSGSVACWGGNQYGELGNGTTTYSSTPVEVSGITDATAIAAGAYHSCVVRGSGSAACWGLNTNGQLGTGQFGSGTTYYSSTPVDVSGITDATVIVTGEYHSCVVRDSGSVACWGAGTNGHLGNGSTSHSSSPVEVTGITDASTIAAGQNHSCAVRDAGTVACWGRNVFGQLGDGTTNGALVPVGVVDIDDATAVGGGGQHSCALRESGTISCWGWNAGGQLGDGTTISSSVPVDVVGTEP